MFAPNLSAACVLYLLLAAQAHGDALRGPGTFLNKIGDLLTSRRLADNCKSLVIRTNDGTISPAQLVAKSDKFDLAVIRQVGTAPRSIAPISVNSDQYVYVP